MIIAMANDHVQYVRRNHPEVAHKTATFKRLVRDLGEVKPAAQANAGNEANNNVAESEVSSAVGSSVAESAAAGEGSNSEVSGVARNERPANLRKALKSRIAEMRLAEVQLESWEEIGDPGAGEQPVFMSSLEEIDAASASAAEPRGIRPVFMSSLEEIDALVDSFLSLFAQTGTPQ